MARYHHTEGICLRRIDYSNTSQVATFLTPEAGRLSFMARGVTRAPRRGIRHGFDLLGRYELIYTERRTGSLLNLTNRSLMEGFRGLRQALERVLCAYCAAELMLNFTIEAQPCRELYGLLLESLRRFESGENLGLSVLLLELGALRHHGACPSFDVCAECDSKLKLTGTLLFSATHGGPLCAACGRRLYGGPGRYVMQVEGRHLAALAGLAAPPRSRPERVSIKPRQIVAASRLLRFHISHLLGKELRTWKYLQDRHLSRTLQRVRHAAGHA